MQLLTKNFSFVLPKVSNSSLLEIDDLLYKDGDDDNLSAKKSRSQWHLINNSVENLSWLKLTTIYCNYYYNLICASFKSSRCVQIRWKGQYITNGFDHTIIYEDLVRFSNILKYIIFPSISNIYY